MCRVVPLCTTTFAWAAIWISTLTYIRSKAAHAMWTVGAIPGAIFSEVVFLRYWRLETRFKMATTFAIQSTLTLVFVSVVKLDQRGSRGRRKTVGLVPLMYLAMTVCRKCECRKCEWKTKKIITSFFGHNVARTQLELKTTAEMNRYSFSQPKIRKGNRETVC